MTYPYLFYLLKYIQYITFLFTLAREGGLMVLHFYSIIFSDDGHLFNLNRYWTFLLFLGWGTALWDSSPAKWRELSKKGSSQKPLIQTMFKLIILSSHLKFHICWIYMSVKILEISHLPYLCLVCEIRLNLSYDCMVC